MSPTQSTSMDAHQLLCHCGCRREQGPFPKDFRHWRRSATALPSQPEDPRASPREKRDDRRCIKDLEQDLRRNEKALAEAAGLLVLPSPQGLEEQPRLHDHAIAPLRQLCIWRSRQCQVIAASSCDGQDHRVMVAGGDRA
jgi:hypothetical protein